MAEWLRGRLLALRAWWLHRHGVSRMTVPRPSSPPPSLPTPQMAAVERWQSQIADSLAALRAERDLYQRRAAHSERER